MIRNNQRHSLVRNAPERVDTELNWVMKRDHTTEQHRRQAYIDINETFPLGVASSMETHNKELQRWEERGGGGGGGRIMSYWKAQFLPFSRMPFRDCWASLYTVHNRNGSTQPSRGENISNSMFISLATCRPKINMSATSIISASKWQNLDYAWSILLF